MMPLTMVRPGETNTIKKISGRDNVRHHLENLGFIVGEHVTVVSKISGDVILQIKDSRIALNREMAQRIIV